MEQFRNLLLHHAVLYVPRVVEPKFVFVYIVEPDCMSSANRHNSSSFRRVVDLRLESDVVDLKKITTLLES